MTYISYTRNSILFMGRILKLDTDKTDQLKDCTSFILNNTLILYRD